MNQNQVLSAVRALLMAAGTILVTRGVISDSGLQDAIGAILTLGSFIWSQYHHSQNPPSAPNA